ncbi:tripartite tricarboxylate transporter TctB family protein [Nocardiopsis potens]|uniref:tripartite tricarboxylate transporter TctB family protein n=1 Tax=Nocardiopsis potens TaxID=1246458 RepID=UPI00037820E5|nr:tripartite tricarboxylate transporter TctB family protein [Nocardiopsis potens]
MSERTAESAEAASGTGAEDAAAGAGVPAPAAAPEDSAGSPDAAQAAGPAEEAAEETAEEAAAPDPETTPWTGRSAWVFPGVTAAFGLLALSGLATIEPPPHATPPGPTVFPAVVGVLLLVLSACMAVVNVRVARRGPSAAPPMPPVAWRPVLIVLGALAVAAALLQALGWLLTGALLFWAVAYAFGARDHLRDAVVALAMSAAVQVGFSLGLGLPLPGGVLELMFP